MFKVYLSNYRYGFDSDIKDKINDIIRRYYQESDLIYPFDLFETNSDNEIERIIEQQSSRTRAKISLEESLTPIVKKEEREILFIQNQIDGLTKEKQKLTDPQKIQTLDRIIFNLQTKRNNIEAEITVNKITQNPHSTPFLVNLYKFTIDAMKQDNIDRTFDIIDFYQMAFRRIGTSINVYQGVWENYMDKDLIDAPSMIFSILSEIIYRIIELGKRSKFTKEMKDDLTVIYEFFDKTKSYINMRSTLPMNLEDNPILAEEMKQLVFIINLVITPPMTNILFSVIYQGIREMDAADTITNDISKTFDEITKLKYHGYDISAFMKEILPMSLLKHYTNTYYNDSDPDRKNTTATSLFTPMMEIIMTIRTVQITENSPLILNIRDKIIPFMEDTYYNFIHYVRLATYGYERYILNTQSITKILKLIIE
jgi:hypothetical protein